MDASQMNQFIGNFNTMQQATEGMSVNSFEEGLMMFGGGLLGILIAALIIFAPIAIKEWLRNRSKPNKKYEITENYLSNSSDYNLIKPKTWT